MDEKTEKESTVVKLKKQVGLHNGVALIVGTVVGSGIFVSPRGVLQQAGSVGFSIIVWAACGLISLVGAICYAELGTSILRSGSDYAYIYEAFGDLPAFLFLWVAVLIIIPTGNAVVALTFGYYIIEPLFPNCGSPETAVLLVAALCLIILTYINCVNVKWATRVQDVFTVTKIISLVIIIAIGLYNLGIGNTDSFKNSFEGSTTDAGHFAMAFYSGLFSYAGWNYLNFVTEEIKDPYKNLPRAIGISLPVVTIVYVLTNVAYFAVLSPQEILSSNAVAVTFGDRTLGPAAWVMPLLVAASTFGGLNGCIFSFGRLFFVGARNGHLPDILGTINVKSYTPQLSLVFLCLLSVLMMVMADIYTLINYVAFVESSFVTLSVAGMLFLRIRRPNMKRPIKVNICFPIFFLAICLFLLVTPLTLNPKECLVGIIVIASGIPVYLIFVAWKTKPASYMKFMGSITIVLQKFFMSVQEDKKED